MDISTVAGLVGSLGFPIVCCLILFWLIKDMNEKHQTEMNDLKEALQQNTNAIEKLETLIQSLQGYITGGDK